jgi:molybdate transport repressor ModE-like protein
MRRNPLSLRRIDADPADLRLFLGIVDTGTITAGAQRVHLSLTAASERLQRLEDALGVSLLERSRAGAKLTGAGRVFERHARMLLAQLDRLAAELTPFAHGMRGSLRLLCNTAALTEFLPQTLARFLARHPDIDVDIEEMWSRQIVQALRERRAEVGIVADSIDVSGLRAVPFRRDELVLVSPRGHPVNRYRRIGFAAALDHPFVGLTADSALFQFLADQAARSGRSVHYRVRLRSFDAVCRMAVDGVGLAIVPRSAALRYVDSRNGVVRKLADAWAERQLLVCTAADADLPPYVDAFIDALCDS